ncbi:hypothetical protein MSG28_010925 [Choristoneura fumiferana]|uniref:Uncharacterized protein n=1 Tax=Choristoneura fumiferana TaxID=7141 RepID=A0ACC0KP73_CHOFU|nr:hypothetical protein MSG28_010925 [Choristoneura fumiferana]
MGSNTSKVNTEVAVQAQKNDSEINSDPRSPTPEISRTPLQGKGGSKHNITKNVDLRKTFENGQTEEKFIHKNPILSAVIKNHLQSYDPRSPTQDFERTPIVIGENVEEIRNERNALRAQNVDNYGSPCLRNDEDADESIAFKEVNPDIVPKNLCNLTFNDSIKDVEEPLGSSTASSDSIKKDSSNESIDKPTKLLETNFDYDETFEKSLENVEQNNHDSKTTTKTNNDKSATNMTYIPKFKVLPEDPRSPSNEIERTPIVVAKIPEESTDDNVEDMSDDTLIQVLQNTNAELIQTMTKPQGQKSDEILIYEDEGSSLNDTPKKCRSVNSNGSRTPLSCMKNKADAVHSRSKSANTLYDPKTQHNGAKKVSHIPRLKSLSKQNTFVPTASSISLRNISKASGIIGDCENTPPHSHRDKWDKDTSIVL